MIKPQIRRRRQMLGIVSEAEYAEFQAFSISSIAKKTGLTITLHESDEPILPYINEGRWVALCVCQSGMAADPDSPVLRCLECGAVYRNVIYPKHVERIESVLLERPHAVKRNWLPTETLDELLAQNIEHLGGL